MLAAAALVVVVGAATAALNVGAVSVEDIAASPQSFGQGKLWLLVSSGLVVEKPLAFSMLSFAALAAVALFVCGARVFWVAAIAGHICSTLVVYLALAAYRLSEPEAFRRIVTSPDYGISAIAAAWLGAIATIAWQERGSTPARKLAIAVSCLAVALFAWTLRGTLNVLDSEHVLAFVIGIGIAGARLRTFAVARDLDPATP
ncbi:MAG: hypothetical protein WAQ33_15945 [Gaiellaceae bacterium]